MLDTGVCQSKNAVIMINGTLTSAPILRRNDGELCLQFCNKFLNLSCQKHPKNRILALKPIFFCQKSKHVLHPVSFDGK